MTLSKEMLDELETRARAMNTTFGPGELAVRGEVVLSLIAAARESEELRPYDELRRHGISVGGAQQSKHMATAACAALGLDYENAAPVDIAKAVSGMRKATRALDKTASAWEDSASCLRSEVARGIAIRQSIESKELRAELLEHCAEQVRRLLPSVPEQTKETP